MSNQINRQFLIKGQHLWTASGDTTKFWIIYIARQKLQNWWSNIETWRAYKLINGKGCLWDEIQINHYDNVVYLIMIPLVSDASLLWLVT